MATKFRYPAGARPLLVEETARRRAVERRLVSLLEGHGFAEIVLPVIDFAEPYEMLASREAARRSYRFTDRDGELVAIRCDFTPMVARALAPSLTAAQLPLRVYYRGDVVRCEPSRLGSSGERFQIGAEIVGDGSTAADIAVLRLVAEMASALGATPLVVYTDTSLSSSFDPATRAALATKRSGHALSGVAAKLVAGSATVDDVATLDAASGERLRTIETALGNEPAFALGLDDVESEESYYTGLRFRVFDRASRRVIAQGGRYDSLYGRFGHEAAAIGFTFTLDAFESAAPMSDSDFRDEGRTS